MLRQNLPTTCLLYLGSSHGKLSSLALSPEEKGRFVGISENFGHDMTFKIFNSSTNKIINISKISSAENKESEAITLL